MPWTNYFLAYWPSAVVANGDNREAMRECVSAYPFFEEIIARGRQMSAVDHWRVAMQTRSEIHSKLARLFSTYDLLITATMPLAAFPHPGPVGGAAVLDGVHVTHPELEFHRLTEPFSHTGHPAIQSQSAPGAGGETTWKIAPDNYFICTPVFDTPVGPHDWLTRHVFVGRGSRVPAPDHTVFDHFIVNPPRSWRREVASQRAS